MRAERCERATAITVAGRVQIDGLREGEGKGVRESRSLPRVGRDRDGEIITETPRR